MTIDTLVSDVWALADEISDEAIRAIGKFAPMNSPREGYAVLREEVDEMWDEVKRNDLSRAIEEAIQVGAMALRFVLDMRPKLKEINAP